MLGLPLDYEVRTVETVRRFVDDIVECDRAKIRVCWEDIGKGKVPLLEFIFNDPRIRCGSPMLAVQLVADSLKNPLAPGRVVDGDELRRHVRNSVEVYLKLEGISITRKVLQHACL